MVEYVGYQLGAGCDIGEVDEAPEKVVLEKAGIQSGIISEGEGREGERELWVGWGTQVD